MEDRFSRLETNLNELVKSVENLESRVKRIEQAGIPAAQESETRIGADPTDVLPAMADIPADLSLTRILSIIGRTFLVLAGAFLLRDFTGSGVLPQSEGVALGFAYAIVWIVFAYHAGGKKKILSATFHGISSVLIAYPLLWEATVKLEVLSPDAATGALTAFTGIALWIAWQQRLRLIAVVYTLAAVAISFFFIRDTEAIELISAFILLLGAATVWLAYGRQWHVMWWFMAIVADLLVLWLTYMAADPHDLPERFANLSIPAVQAIAVGHLVVYLGSFAIHTLVRRRDVTLFEVFQSAAALLVGYGGAVRIASPGGSGITALGVSALTASIACYALAFAFVHRHLGRGRNFFFYVWLALILAFLGTWLVAGKGLLVLCWSVLAVAAAFFGGYFDRITLRTHSAVYAVAAAWHAGLVLTTSKAFSVSAGYDWEHLSSLNLVVWAMMVACYIVLLWTQKGREVRPLKRLPRFVVLLLSVLGCGGYAVIILVRFFAYNGGEVNPSGVALVRTAVIAFSAIALALGGRRSWLAELSWLVPPILMVGGVKLVFEDLQCGSPGTLFLGFVCYGIALIMAPRLLRRERK
ncbi:MAG: DUF2339 domain-containing protein [Planctomycetota bacterium]|jgi:hypothetical protein